MTDEKRESAPGAETPGIGAPGAPVHERRMTARRKQKAILQLLRGEPLETVPRELRVSAADLSGWRDAFLEAGAASLKSQPRNDRHARIGQLQAKLVGVTMECELLEEKIARMEEGRHFDQPRSRR